MGKIIIPIALLLCAVGVGGTAPPAPSAEGLWLTEKKSGIVEIFRCSGEALCGRLVWFRIKPGDPNPTGLDINNPDPARRGQPLCGLAFMTGFRPAGPNHWDDGALYDPESGSTYHGTMRLRPDGTLDLHGYIGIALFGRSERWTRYAEPVPPCPSR